MKDVVREARAFALERHGDQKYGKLTYEFHLQSVADMLITYPAHVQAAAWLHDVVEDTYTSIHEIAVMFGLPIADIVDACTDGEGETRAERKACAYKKLMAASHEARAVKLADRISNMRASIENPKRAARYRDEFPSFIRACGGDERNYALIIESYRLYMISNEALK